MALPLSSRIHSALWLPCLPPLPFLVSVCIVRQSGELQCGNVVVRKAWPLLFFSSPCVCVFSCLTCLCNVPFLRILSKKEWQENSRVLSRHYILETPWACQSGSFFCAMFHYCTLRKLLLMQCHLFLWTFPSPVIVFTWVKCKQNLEQKFVFVQGIKISECS